MKAKPLTPLQLVEELTKNIPREERELTEELIEESDRGLTLVCAEVFNLELEKLFRKRFSIQDPAQMKKIIDPIFEVGGVLSSFSSRIRFAYALGYIPEPLFLELEKIRSIRNKFAHSSRPLRLTSPSLSSLIGKFILGRKIQALFLQNELLPTFHVGNFKKASAERWLFLGAFMEIHFVLKSLNGSDRSGEYLARELERITKECYS